MRFPRAFLVSVCTGLCVSCATPTPRPAPEILQRLWQEHSAAVQPLQHWELRGRLAVHADERGGQASLVWRHDGERNSIRLAGPLGRGMLQLTQDETGAQLQDAEHRVLRAANYEALLWRYTGWDIPVANLNFWVRGLPVPKLQATSEWDDLGRLKTLQQQGWQVQFEDYVRYRTYELPSRLHLTRRADESQTQPAVDVRLVIDRWEQVQ